MVLNEVNGERNFPIWIGKPEATALALHLEHVSLPRPLTYAFAAQILTAAGGNLREVRIDRLMVMFFTPPVWLPDRKATTRSMRARVMR